MAERKSPEEQYKLIMECRSSGMSDYQWCTSHGINPGTFYNWVSRLRKKACEIPEAAGKDDYLPEARQDIVKLELVEDPIVELPSKTPAEIPAPPADQAPVVIHLKNASISLQNTVDPSLLKHIFSMIGNLPC